MAYSKEIVRRARQRLAEAKADRDSENQQHLMQAYAQVPRIREIDQMLRRSMVLAAQAVFTQGGDAELAMEQVKEANLALQKERLELAQAHFEPGYLDETPICEVCGGSGYVGSNMCQCLRELCRQEQKRQLSLLSHSDARFENFRLDYYSDRMDTHYGASPRELMERTLTSCRKYALNFGAGSENMLFSGGTGLGKTYLSACIARVVADRGFSVSYESAQHLFAKLEKDRFNPDPENRMQLDEIMESDLLILDDLGTELPGNFVTAAFYSLLNDRLLAGKPMIISTNLNAMELAQRYSPQIASRLQGHFRQKIFLGEDIRVKLNRGF